MPIKRSKCSNSYNKLNVKHQLEGSEYSSRRKQCELVSQTLKKSFRDTDLNELNGLDLL